MQNKGDIQHKNRGVEVDMPYHAMPCRCIRRRYTNKCHIVQAAHYYLVSRPTLSHMYHIVIRYAGDMKTVCFCLHSLNSFPPSHRSAAQRLFTYFYVFDLVSYPLWESAYVCYASEICILMCNWWTDSSKSAKVSNFGKSKVNFWYLWLRMMVIFILK